MTFLFHIKTEIFSKHWLIDEEAAAVVRRIFHFTIEGCGPYDIARTLFDDKVETPAVYFTKKELE